MCSTRVLGLFAVLVGLAESFSWENIPSAKEITAVAYDPVHYRVFFADYTYPNITISSFEIPTRNIQLILAKKPNGFFISRVIYDPVTQLLFWIEGYSIYSYSLNSALSNQADGNLVVSLDHDYPCRDIAVDSCGGYIYWMTDFGIEKARLDGSKREVLIHSHVSRLTFAIDQQTEKIYWTEIIYNDNRGYESSIESADFYGKNHTTIHVETNKIQLNAGSLAISRDSLYLISTDSLETRLWQLQKKPTGYLERNLRIISESTCGGCHRLAANYTLKNQNQGVRRCEGVQYLVSNDEKPECALSICHNYCVYGNCSVSAEGEHKCSCQAGYSGERCEVNVCYKHCLNNGICYLNEEDEPVCECTADYEGERCDVAIIHTDADNTTQHILQDLRTEVNHLKRILQLFSQQIDEYEAKI